MIARLPIVGVAFALGLSVGACFEAPRPAVQFSCDPVDAPQCPPDYACEADGCCHLIGSDVAANEGQCQLGGAVPTGGPPATSSGSSGGSSSGGSGSSGSGSTAQGSSTQGSSTQGSDTQGSDTQGSSTQGSDGSSGSTATSSSSGASSSSGTG